MTAPYDHDRHAQALMDATPSPGPGSVGGLTMGVIGASINTSAFRCSVFIGGSTVEAPDVEYLPHYGTPVTGDACYLMQTSNGDFVIIGKRSATAST